jgi:hypothetical protein
LLAWNDSDQQGALTLDVEVGDRCGQPASLSGQTRVGLVGYEPDYAVAVSQILASQRQTMTPRPHRADRCTTGVGPAGDEGMAPHRLEPPPASLVLRYSNRYLSPIRWATVT